MTIEQELQENHALIDKLDADIRDAEEFGDDAAIPALKRTREELIALRGRMVAKQAYLKASGG
jgi:hypothetical protein